MGGTKSQQLSLKKEQKDRSFSIHSLSLSNLATAMMMIMMMISNKKFLVTFFFFFLCAIFVLAEEVSIFDAVREDFEGIKDIRSLVQKDASLLESIGPGGQTPLISAVLQGKFHAVKTLLELGANAFATEKDGYNVLHAAGFQGRPMILRLLLDHFSEQSIDMNVATDQHADGYYPLHVSFCILYAAWQHMGSVFAFSPAHNTVFTFHDVPCAMMLLSSGRVGAEHHAMPKP